MDKKYFGMIIIIIALVLLVGIIYTVFFYKFPSTPAEKAAPVSEEKATSTSSAANQPASSVEQPAIINIESKPLGKAELQQEDLKRLASSFAERFGSFSNHSNYGNIQDLKLFMSSKMKVWADKYITEAIARAADTSIYYGITTKAIAADVKQFDDNADRAEILVKTKRRESTGVTSNSSGFYQDIFINFAKENGAWKVDSAYWQAK